MDWMGGSDWFRCVCLLCFLRTFVEILMRVCIMGGCK
jgi:hypothetical protein